MRRKAANSDWSIWSNSSVGGCLEYGIVPVFQRRTEICGLIIIIVIGVDKFIVLIVFVEMEQNAVLARTWVGERTATVLFHPK